MKYKTPHKTYILLLVLSILITGIPFLVEDNPWSTIISSIGTGGIASVCVAWLLDDRNTRNRNNENKKRIEIILTQIVQAYLRLMWVTANECFGLCSKDEFHSFQGWLIILISNISNCPEKGQASIISRCNGIAGSIISLQRQIEIIQSQSMTLIFEDFPDVEKSLQKLGIIWIHCWGTIKQLETDNYKGFCETTNILLTDFINAFPQYQENFPEEYNITSLELKGFEIGNDSIR